MSDRTHDLSRFYDLLAKFGEKTGGPLRLSDCSARMDWSKRGVYFFQEPNEVRSNTGTGLRIVRVGTHALMAKSKTTLWKRLRQHRSGKHRGSIFRLLVGAALKKRDGWVCRSWGQSGSIPREVRDSERPLEDAVSETLGNMSLLWLAVDDEPGPDSKRAYIERNAIALLSNYNKEPVDPASSGWLGWDSDRERVRRSSLWNNNHVDEQYDSAFLDTMESLIDQMT